MNSFNKTVLVVASVILIIALLILAYVIYVLDHNPDAKFPPVEGNCPDFWTSDFKHGINYCENKLKIGSDHRSLCNRFSPQVVNTDCKRWSLATNCEITWDGITNNNKLDKKCRNTPMPVPTDPEDCPSNLGNDCESQGRKSCPKGDGSYYCVDLSQTCRVIN